MDSLTLLIIIGAVFLVLLFFLSKSIVVVHQAEAMIIERFGKFQKVLDSGINFIVPFFDSPRSTTWTDTGFTPGGHINEKTYSTARVDLREKIFGFKANVFSNDTVPLDVKCLIYYRVTDVYAAVYNVPDLLGSIESTAQSQLKEFFGTLTLSEAICGQDRMVSFVMDSVISTFEEWGVTVQRMEILEIKVTGSTADSLENQVIAERQRRGEFIEGEGARTAVKLKAEGFKMKTINMGLAEQESARKISEGRAKAKIEVASAEATALSTLRAAVLPDGLDYTDFVLTRRLITSLKNANDKAKQNFIFPLPANVFSLLNTIQGTNQEKFASFERKTADFGELD
eukprot:TRINITY_DN2855_c0_g1_i1.p1 TRINITY_DN2855_c0_g1~~TRINITY_DN2855_c0_g1_i1.p1  ORF type:complete len:342 (-),score=95.12 TRINITY_DN2855_c0_g1_i1:105-1130(-)